MSKAGLKAEPPASKAQGNFLSKLVCGHLHLVQTNFGTNVPGVFQLSVNDCFFCFRRQIIVYAHSRFILSSHSDIRTLTITLHQ